MLADTSFKGPSYRNYHQIHRRASSVSLDKNPLDVIKSIVLDIMKDIALESPPPMVSLLRFFSAITDESKKDYKIAGKLIVSGRVDPTQNHMNEDD
jgi:hypothetical protein